ncbi:hypothetical protein PV05_06292 [Exophiala xenobiotica]|uniref:Uncharacterized protein n=1 Tax=Exophiala xenobiotica TaxID=348802 RepID=A0A0D2CUV2_9EURO|nr:uncharacterized protein PV05_06292 [Exophiala xenobiotica]KIW53882.1 hypothetical protein PV05_06292 [Exophiala xenobiotica]
MSPGPKDGASSLGGVAAFGSSRSRSARAALPDTQSWSSTSGLSLLALLLLSGQQSRNPNYRAIPTIGITVSSHTARFAPPAPKALMHFRMPFARASTSHSPKEGLEHYGVDTIPRYLAETLAMTEIVTR